MVTQAEQRQLDGLGTRGEQADARIITEQLQTTQAPLIPSFDRTAGHKRLIQFFINQPEAVRRLRASGSVGEAAARRRGARRRGVRFVGIKPTATEQALKMNLPRDLRNLSVKEIIKGQSLSRTAIKRIIPLKTRKLIEKKLQQFIQLRKPTKTIKKQREARKEAKRFLGKKENTSKRKRINNRRKSRKINFRNKGKRIYP